MRLGNEPPTAEELEGWRMHAARRTDQHESWKHLPPCDGDSAQEAAELELEQRVRRIAPADASLVELCHLAELIESGMADSDALVWLYQVREGGADDGRASNAYN